MAIDWVLITQSEKLDKLDSLNLTLGGFESRLIRVIQDGYEVVKGKKKSREEKDLKTEL